MDGIGIGEEGYVGPPTLEEEQKNQRGIGIGEEGYVGPPGYDEQVQAQIRRVRELADTMENPEEEFDRILAADYIGQMVQKPTAHVYRNLDEYAQVYFQTPEIPKNIWQSVQDEFTRSNLSVQAAKVGMDMLTDPYNEEHFAALAEINAKMPTEDIKDRNILEKTLKATATIAPSMGYMLANGLVTGGIGAALGGAAGFFLGGPGAGAAGAAKGYNWGAKLGSGKESFSLAAGGIYQEIMMLEVPDTGKKLYELMLEDDGAQREGIRDIAMAAAIGGGTISAAIETVSSSFSRLTGTASSLSDDIADKIIHKVLKEGYATKAVSRVLLKYPLNAVGEGFQEVGQELAEAAAVETAKTFLNEVEGHNLTKAEEGEWVDLVKDTFTQTFLGMMGLGLPGAAVSMYGEGAAAVNEKAQTVPAKKMFEKTDDSISLPITEVQNISQVLPKSKEYKEAQAAYVAAKSGKAPMKPIRVVQTEDGYVALDGPQLQVALEEGDTAIQVQVVADDSENPVAAQDMDGSGNPKPKPKEAWEMTSSEFKGEAQVAADIDQEIIQVRTQDDLKRSIKKHIPSMTDKEVSLAMSLVRAVAPARNMGVDEFIQDAFAPEVFSHEQINVPTTGRIPKRVWENALAGMDIPEGITEELAHTTQSLEEADGYGAYKLSPKGIEEANSLFKDVEGISEALQDVVFQKDEVMNLNKISYKAARQMLDDGRSLIHVTERADFTSFVHEFTHVVRPYLPKADQDALLEYYGKQSWAAAKGDAMEDTPEERFVKDVEDYLATGESPVWELRDIFKKIAESLKRFWESLKRELPQESFPPEIKDIFDRMFSGKEKEEFVGDPDLDLDVHPDAIFQTEAYHGTTAGFKKFSVDYMGAGEGAQEYGWGLYFTDKEDIARSYADTNAEIKVQGVDVHTLDELEFKALGMLIRHGYDVDATIKKFQKNAESGTDQQKAQAPKQIEWLKAHEKNITKERHLYQVTLHPGFEELWLSWTDTFPQALKSSVKTELEAMGLDPDLEGKWTANASRTGGEVYDAMVAMIKEKTGKNTLMAKKEASLLLHRAGVDGIKFPANSLGIDMGDDLWNYVVFDQEQIKINSHVLFQADIEVSNDDISKLNEAYEAYKNGKILGGGKFPKLVEMKEKKSAQFKSIVDAVIAGENLFHEESGNGQIAVLHKATREDWEYQTSYFDNRGPYRHHNGNTLKEMVEELHRSGNFIPGRGTEKNSLFPIDPTASPAFKEWFADSKVVTNDGKPLVVYQGNIQSFDSMMNPRFGGSWFSTALPTAEIFAGRSEAYDADGKAYEHYSQGGRITPAYLSIQNPKTVDISDTLWDWEKEVEFIDQAKADGHDGLIVDHGPHKKDYVVFEQSQIKSVNNRGSWNKFDNRILFQPDKLIEQALENRPELKAKVEEHKGTPYANMVGLSAALWEGVDQVIAGTTVDEVMAHYDGIGTKGGAALRGVFNAVAEGGKDALWDYTRKKGLLGGAKKPGAAVNGHFSDCNPSKNCAKYCYACKGRYTFMQTTVKQELVGYVVKTWPERSADTLAAEFKLKFPTGWETRPLRLFDRGDLSEEWLPVIQRLNDKGISTHIFSKRPEILRKVDASKNVVLLSVDETNIDLARENPDLPLALVYAGDQDLPYLDEFKDQLQVILPVKNGDDLLPKPVMDALVAKAKENGLNSNLCPVDSGRKKLTNGVCATCLAGKGIGCYSNNKPTAKKQDVKVLAEDVFAKIGALSEEEKRQFVEIYRGLLERTGGSEEKAIDNLRESFDPVTAEEGDPHSEPRTEEIDEYLFQLDPDQGLELDYDYINEDPATKDLTAEGALALHNTIVEIKQTLYDNQILNDDILDELDGIKEIADLDGSITMEFWEGIDSRYPEEILADHELDEEPEEFIIEDDVLEFAKITRGVTEDINLAGYVLPDGDMLNFSEGYGDRDVDHRQLNLPTKGDISGTDRMIAFQRAGAIRMDAAAGYVDMETKPTPEQMRVIDEVFYMNDGGALDMADGTRSISVDVENPRKVRGIINRFYRGEDVPQTLFQPEHEFIREGVEKRSINRDNFFNRTEATFTKSDTPGRTPDYESESGSKYWYEDQGVYRQSDHWGHSVASNNWYLDGQKGTKDSFDYDEGIVTGYSPWERFVDLDYKGAQGEVEWYFQEAKNNGGRAYIKDNTLFYENSGNTVEIMKVRPKNETLFQPDPEHEALVRQAVEDFKPVPKEVLEEYAHTDWAQKEIRRRKEWEKYAYLESLAVGYDSWEELRDWFNSKNTGNPGQSDGEWGDRFYRELWLRANQRSREDANADFIKRFATKEGVVALASEISANPHNFKNQGIPGPLFTLRGAANRKVKEQHYKAAITAVKRYTTEIRRGFALARNDETELQAIAFEDEMEALIPLETKVAKMDPRERFKQAFKTDDMELRRALLSGELNQESLADMFEVAQREIATLKAKETIQKKELSAELGWSKDAISRLNQTLEAKIKEAQEAQRLLEGDKLQAIKDTREKLKAQEKKNRDYLMTKELMRAMAANIARKPSPLTIHIDYQREILDLQMLLDPGFRRKNNVEEWIKKSEFYEKHPALMKILSQEEKEKISKKPLNLWTLEDLSKLNNSINELRDEGRKAFTASENDKRERAMRIATSIALQVNSGKMPHAPLGPHTEHNEEYRAWLESSIPDQIKAATWRPSRLLRAIGGVAGVLETYFWRDINTHVDAELKAVEARIEPGKKLLAELGMKLEDLQKPIMGHSGAFPVNDVIQWYIVRDNEKNMKALEFGVGIPVDHMQDYFDQLTPAHIKLAEFIAKDFEDNYDRYAKAYGEDKNIIMGKVEGGYFPMRRLRLMESEREEDSAKDLLSSRGVGRATARRRGSNSRIDIADEHQQPIRLGAFDLWMEEVQEQEHYIQSGLFIKEMQRVVRDPVFKAAIVDKHGKVMLDWFSKYVDEFANPTLYKFYDQINGLSKMLRNNMAVAYLSCNMMTVAKQFPSVALFLGRTGPVKLLAAAGKFAANPRKWIEWVDERDPQMKSRSMDRVFEELKNVKPTQWDKSVKTVQRAKDNWEEFVKKWGEIGMKPISVVDKMATTIGWMAVYDTHIKDAGEAEAIRLAQEAVLETQPAARAKDLAQLYRSSEGINWFIMFTNQINQTWNIITADIPLALKSSVVEKKGAAKTGDDAKKSILDLPPVGEGSKEKLPKGIQAAMVEKALGMVTGMMISFAGIALLSGWKPWEEEDPEGLAKSSLEMISKAIMNTVPVGGKMIVSGYDGWMGGGTDPLPVAEELGRLLKSFSSGDDFDNMKKSAAKVAEAMAVMSGTPIMPIKRGKKAVNALTQGEPLDAALESLGYRTNGDY